MRRVRQRLGRIARHHLQRVQHADRRTRFGQRREQLGSERPGMVQGNAPTPITLPRETLGDGGDRFVRYGQQHDGRTPGQAGKIEPGFGLDALRQEAGRVGVAAGDGRDLPAGLAPQRQQHRRQPAATDTTQGGARRAHRAVSRRTSSSRVSRSGIGERNVQRSPPTG